MTSRDVYKLVRRYSIYPNSFFFFFCNVAYNKSQKNSDVPVYFIFYFVLCPALQ